MVRCVLGVKLVVLVIVSLLYWVGLVMFMVSIWFVVRVKVGMFKVLVMMVVLLL